MTERSVTWVVSEMDEEMKLDVERQVNKAMDDDTANENDISKAIKQFFDSNYGANWHCCVGKHFASYVTY